MIVAPKAPKKVVKSPLSKGGRPTHKKKSKVFPTLTVLAILNLIVVSWVAYQIYEAKYLSDMPTTSEAREADSTL